MHDFVAGVLQRIVDRLEQAQVPYMLVGSMASFLYGEPRMTRDIDIVVDLNDQRLRALLKLLPHDEFYVSHEAAFEALRQRSMFNVIDNSEAWKVDLIVCSDQPMDRRALANRRPATFEGVQVIVQSPEDTILSKLQWSKKAGNSERQLRDVAGILRISGPDLDMQYIEEWIPKLGLQLAWAQAQAAAKPGS